MSNLPFFQAIAPNDEMAIANRMKELALEEFKLSPTKGDAAKFTSMFLYAQWLERTTKVLLTLHRKDVVGVSSKLSKANKDQYHSIVEPIHDFWKLGNKENIGPGYWNQAKAVLDNADVNAFLEFVQSIADAKVGRYNNLETMAGKDKHVAFTMELDSILTTAATNRLGSDQYRLDKGDYEVVREHSDRFFESITKVLTFILHFPVGQGVFGDKARQQVAFQFNPMPPEMGVFLYLINEGKRSS